MKQIFFKHAWGNSLYQQSPHRKSQNMINKTHQTFLRTPFSSVGKQKPPCHGLTGYGLTCINDEHHIAYKVMADSHFTPQTRYRN